MRTLLIVLAAVADAKDDTFRTNGCTETNSSSGETCSQAFDRGVPCSTLYKSHLCCSRCDPCGIDGTQCAAVASDQPWVSPNCACDKVVVTGACSSTGCAKPDALGVYTLRSTWRTGDGRYVYVKDDDQPHQHLHSELIAHKMVDESSGTNKSATGYLYFNSGLGRWVVGPNQLLNDDNYARSVTTRAACPDAIGRAWLFWWSGQLPTVRLPSGLRITATRGWKQSPRYPLQVTCWANPPSPPPPPPSPPSPSPPPPPAPPPPLRLVPGPYQGRLEIYYVSRTTPSYYPSLPPTLLQRLRASQANRSGWGTICDDGFDARDAAVACRQLGLGRPLRFWHGADATDDDDDSIPTRASPRSPSAPIWMENLQCGGEEASLVECGFSGWGRTDCTHGEDIFIMCSVPRKPPPPPPSPSPSPPPPVPRTVLEKLSAPENLPISLLGLIGSIMLILILFVCVAVVYLLVQRGGGRRLASARLRTGAGDREMLVTLEMPEGGGGSTEAQEALSRALQKALEAGGSS